MAELLRITDVPEEFHEDDDSDLYKLLYVLEEEENKVVVYFWSNPDSLTDEELQEQYFDEIYEEADEIKNIGEVEVEDDGEGNIWLKQIEVETEYRQNGIASILIELAVARLELSSIACVQEHSAYVYDLTPSGEMLIASCVRNNIIPPAMCHFSDDVPLDDNGSDDEDDNPGYDSLLVRQALPVGFQVHGVAVDTDDDHYVESSEADGESDDSYDSEPTSPQQGTQHVTGRYNIYPTEGQSTNLGSDVEHNSEEDDNLLSSPQSPR